MEYNFRFGAVLRYSDLIVEGVLLTLQLSAVTMVIGLAIGLSVAAMSTTGPLTITIDDGVALLHLDDGKANALSHEVIELLHGGLDRALADANAVVIAGRPGRFSAGFDLAVMSSGDKPMQDLVLAGAEWLLRFAAGAVEIERGGGLEVAQARRIGR